MRVRLAVVAVVAATAALARAQPAWAHGIAARSDLPLPTWLFAVGAGTALIVSFSALRFLWPRPRLEQAAEGRPLPGLVQRLAPVGAGGLRVIGLVALGATIAAGAFGPEMSTDNLAPVMVYVIFWVGLPILSAFVGDVWHHLSPYDTVAALAQRVRGRRSMSAPPEADSRSRWFTHWPASVGLFGFLWLELAFHSPADPRVLAGALVGYSVYVLVCAARFGRAWLRTGEGFGVLFGLLASIAPVFRDDEAKLRVRLPFTGLARVEVLPGTVAVVMVVLGGTTFDGLSRTQLWVDTVGSATGWELTLYNTIGLVWAISVVAMVYQAACWLVARLTGEEHEDTVPDYVHSLIPIMLAYAIAHYFSLVVFEGQHTMALASDPLGRGWDLFGTAGYTIDYLLISTAAIAYVQAAAIVVGHVAGVVAAHDRAVELVDPRTAFRGQYPMLAVMVLYTVGGLSLLLGA